MQTRSQTRSISNANGVLFSLPNDRRTNDRRTNNERPNNERPKRNIAPVNYAEYSDPEDTFFELTPRIPRGQKTTVNNNSSAITLEPKYSVDIDFDESSRAWRANKRFTGQCHYTYRTPEKDNIRKEVVEHVERRSSRLANKASVSFAEYA